MTQEKSQVLFPPLLLATDGSPSARVAQKLLCRIAPVVQRTHEQGQPTVILLTVQPRRSSRSQQRARKPRPTAGLKSPEVIPEPQEDLQAPPIQVAPESALPATPGGESPENLIQALRAEFPDSLAIAVEIRQGRPATEILNCARTIQTGLIAVGHRGISGMRELLLGSVSSVIARYAPCNVLIARSSAKDPTADPKLDHALLVVGGAAGNRQAIAVTRQLAKAGIRQITILCAQAPLNANYLFAPFGTPTPTWQLSQSLQAAQKDEGEQILHHANQMLEPLHLEVQTVLQKGDPGPIICQMAQQRQVDLIILGSDVTRRSLLAPLQSLRKSKPQPDASLTQRSTLRNTRLSATEDYVIHHAPCPVLLCRRSLV